MGENHVFRSTDSNRMFTPEARAKPSKFGNEWLRAAIDNFRPGENFGEPQVHLARALGNLHAVFEVDGDFKPDNVLLTRTGHIFVGDPLGNGTIFTRLFRQNQGGTPGYRAPEIRDGGTISRAGDSYACGVTLHHLLTGRSPIEGQGLEISPEEYEKAPNVCEVIIACCQHDPNTRPSMEDVLRILGGETWANIQAQRMAAQREAVGAVGAMLLIGLAVVGVAKLAA
ncbi:MAG: hypothetical protein DMG30_13445 [Acidobacteria bacterium]|nr:MAG: hypothetical protein DMG30_13445 [Acidobacteriota bacterium]